MKRKSVSVCFDVPIDTGKSGFVRVRYTHTRTRSYPYDGTSRRANRRNGRI